MKGLFKYLTPFAPDQSGAVSVLYEFGGLLVICDAGGCTGNICGFDEPRWSYAKSAMFSAGLRDMDAIMGRDELLVHKLALVAKEIEGNFAAVIGTPVPAVIGTDYLALARMIEKKIGIPAITVDSTGTYYYDKGAQAAYLQLVKTFCKEALPVEENYIGVFGANPLDMGDLKFADKLTAWFQEENKEVEVVCYGMGAGIEELKKASKAKMNLVVAPSGLKAAQYLKETFGTPYKIANPLALSFLGGCDYVNKKVLIIQQQVSADTLRNELLQRGAREVIAANWFMQLSELTNESDVFLTEEDECEALIREGAFDVIIADSVFFKMTEQAYRKHAEVFCGTFIEYPQFAISGKLVE